MFESIKKSIKKKFTCLSMKLRVIKIMVKKINSDNFITEGLQNNLMTEGLHSAQLLI